MENDNGQELTEQGMIFYQIQRIANLNNQLYDDTTLNYTRGIRNFIAGIDLLETQVVRHLDKTYFMKKNILKKRFADRYYKYINEHPSENQTGIGKQFEADQTILYGRYILALILKTLDRHGVFERATYSAIDLQGVPMPENSEMSTGDD